MKKILAFVCLVMSVLLLAACASAEEENKISNVTYRGGAEHFFVFPDDEDLFQNFKMMMPGETRNQTIIIQNDYQHPLYFYMHAEEAPNETVKGVRLIDTLQFHLVKDGEEMYDGTLADSVTEMSEDIILGYLAPGETATLTATLRAPGWEMGNQYMWLNAVVDWVFTVMEDDDDLAPVKTVNVGNGKNVKAGDKLTYMIEYLNSRRMKTDLVIRDKLDANLIFVSATDGGSYNRSNHTVTWRLKGVEALTSGSVSLTVTVKDSAKGKTVTNEAGLSIGRDTEIISNQVENPVDEDEVPPEKTVDLEKGMIVKEGDSLTYAIKYTNHLNKMADVIIRDKLDPNVVFVSAEDGGQYDPDTHTVTWTLSQVDALAEGSVTLTVMVKVGAEAERVINSAGVQIADELEIMTNLIEIPIEPAIGSLKVEKIWKDEDDRDGLRPASVTVQVSNQFETVGTYELNEENAWCLELQELPKFSPEGELLMYLVEELGVPEDYTVQYIGDNVTISIINKHTHIDGYLNNNEDDIPLASGLNMNEGECFD